MPRLVPFAPEHFALLASWFRTERDLLQWGGPFLSFPLSAAQLTAMLDEGRLTPPTRHCWMAEDDGGLVGHAQLVFDWRNGNARLSRVAVAPDVRGRGLAGPMLKLVVAQAFGFDSIERVELNVYAWNIAAIRAYKRLGFKEEGVRRSSTRVVGERWDTAVMGLLRREWLQPAPNES
jgi:RimJ/RimL family protein N-acetyltransferase